ncbi:DUF5320 domain-containing protein [Paenibacillus xylanexedens]|uniref:DUF5320 domain-containing protein n=1 Tax=Paenibacillus xylanexedens TaxID=528191 RepID=UPI000F53F646|nr:DUF5320 domain-containing protein [Paenibacillus xylanexedens]RPK20074.1 hypothetical protein EDO6_06591 [Paenibacillus xylanexedens]
MDSKDFLLASGYKKLEVEVAVGSYEEIPQLDPDLMHLRFIMCHAVENANGDTFSNEVLKEAQFTPKNKPVNWEHGQPIIGTILDSVYREDPMGVGYIEATGVVWKFIYPELASQIKEKASSGGLRLSMECYYKDANYKVGDQIFDNEQAEKMGIIPYVGREYMGKKVARIFKEVIFGGVGVVANPADKRAVFLSVANVLDYAKENSLDSQETKALLSDYFNSAFDEDGYIPSEKAAEIIRQVNDFTRKTQTKEDVSVTAIAKYIKAFDKAKSSVVSKFNKESIQTKEQMLVEIRNTVNTLLSEIASINNSYSVGFASVNPLGESIQEKLNIIYASNEGIAEAYLTSVEEDYVTYDLVDYSLNHPDSFKTLKAKFVCNDEIGIDISGVTEIQETEVNELKDTNQETVEVVENAEATQVVEDVVENAEATETVEETVEEVEAAKEDKEDQDGGAEDEGKDEKPKSKKKVASESNAELEALKQENASLKSELEAMKSQLGEIALEKTLASRLADLKESGIEFTGSRLEKESAKLKSMSNEDYADHKELLMEVAGKNAVASVGETQEAEEATASEEVVEEDIVVEGAKASAGLNIEAESAKEVRPFGHLARQ